jgi:ribosomal protein S18 acetylase RimI-like enzyme
MSQPVIKEISDPAGIRTSAVIIKESFQTVALEFGLTQSNCPSHPSNITFEQLQEVKKKGLNFFGLYLNEKQVGFVAVEPAKDDISHFEKLAVLPEYRRHGYGAELVKFSLDLALKNGGKKVAIGIIDEHTVLKKWYQGLGFSESGTQKFSHLPFTVRFLEKELKMVIRPYSPEDETAVIALWQHCELTRPWNNPRLDIERKLKVNPELFLIGLWNGRVVATAMGGYEGHRGWVNYLAVNTAYQKQGFGRQIMEALEKKLLDLGCPKINLQVRQGNSGALQFYSKIGYKNDAAVSLGKRLIEDPPE